MLGVSFPTSFARQAYVWSTSIPQDYAWVFVCADKKLMPKRSIDILDVTIDRENFPVLFEWAKESPKWLETTLLSMQAKQGGEIISLVRNLESDLESKRLY